MQHTMSYSVGGRVFDLPSDKVQGFLETAKANGDAPEEAYSYRVSVKDGGSREFTIPRSKYEGFKKTAEANGDTVEQLRTMTMADGSRRSFTMKEMSDYLRSDEYRNSKDAKESREAIESRLPAPTVKGDERTFSDELNASGGGAIGRMLGSTVAGLFRFGGQMLRNAAVASPLGMPGMNLSGVDSKRALESVKDNAADKAGNCVSEWTNVLFPEVDANGVVQKTTAKTTELGAGLAKFGIMASNPYSLAALVAENAGNSSYETYDAAIRGGMSPEDANGLAMARGFVDGGITAAFAATPVKRLAGALGLKTPNVALPAVKDAIKGGASTAKNQLSAGIAKAMAVEAAKSAAEMGGLTYAQGLFDNAAMQEAANPDKPIDWEKAAKDAGWEALEQAGMGAALGLLPTPVRIAKARKALNASIADAVRAPNGAETFMGVNPEGATSLAEAYRKNGTVSRKDAQRAGLPEMNEADRNGIAKRIIDVQEKWDTSKEVAAKERVAAEAEMAKRGEQNREEREMGERIEAEGEAQRKAAADKEQADYDEKMAAYEEARAKREAEKKRFGRAKTELPEKPTTPELRVEEQKKPVIEADLSDTSKKTAQVGEEEGENAEIGATKAENAAENVQPTKVPDGRGRMVEKKDETQQPSQPLEDAPSRAPQEKGTTSQSEAKKPVEARSRVDGYVSSMKPMVAAKTKKSLGSKRDYGTGNNHDVMTDAEFVEKQVGKGAVMTANVFHTNGKPKVEYVLGDTVITKTQSDYARHLGAKIDNNSIERAKEEIALKSAVDKVTDATNGSYSPYEASDENIAKHIAEFEKRDEKSLRKLLDIRPDMKAEYDALKSIRDARIKRGDWSVEARNGANGVVSYKIASRSGEQIAAGEQIEAENVSFLPSPKGGIGNTIEKAKARAKKEGKALVVYSPATTYGKRIYVKSPDEVSAIELGRSIKDDSAPAIIVTPEGGTFKVRYVESPSTRVPDGKGRMVKKPAATAEESSVVAPTAQGEGAKKPNSIVDADTAKTDENWGFRKATNAIEFQEQMHSREQYWSRLVSKVPDNPPVNPKTNKPYGKKTPEYAEFIANRNEQIRAVNKEIERVDNLIGEKSPEWGDASDARADNIVAKLEKKYDKTKLSARDKNELNRLRDELSDALGEIDLDELREITDGDGNISTKGLYQYEPSEAAIRVQEAYDAIERFSEQAGKYQRLKRDKDGRPIFERKTPADRTSDPAIVEWAKKRGETVTTGADGKAKVSEETVRRFNADQIGKAVNATKNLIKGVKVETVGREWSDALDNPDGADKSVKLKREGRVVGTYDPVTKKVRLYSGADASTVYHELIGHAVHDWAKDNSKPLYEKLNALAKDAPKELVDEIRSNYPDADEATIAKEIIAHIAGKKGVENITPKLKDKPSAWYAKAYVAVRDAILDFMQKIGFRRIDVKKLESMTPMEAMDYLTEQAAKGRMLGKADATDVGALTKYDRWATKFYDRKAAIEPVSKDAADAKALQPGKEYDFQLRNFDVKKKEFGKILADNDIAEESVADYMRAQSAPERNRRLREEFLKENKGGNPSDYDLWVQNNGGSGWSDERAAEHMKFFNSLPKERQDAIKKAADFLWKMQKEGMERRVEAGLISREDADALMAAEQYHIPWKSAISEFDGEWRPWRGKNNFKAGEFAKAKGRATEAGDPIAWMFEEFSDAHLRAIENDSRALLARDIEASGKFGKVVQNTPQNQMKELRVKGGEGQANVVNFKRDGKTYSIVLDGERGDAIGSAFTNRDLAHMPKKVQAFMRWWSSTATEWSPTFAVRNLIADNADIARIVLAEQGVKQGVKTLAKYAVNRQRVAKEMWHFARTGEMVKGGVLEQYSKEGGMIGGFQRQGYENLREQMSYENIRKQFEKDAKKGRNRTKSVLSLVPKAFSGIKMLNTYAELSSRVAMFKTNVDAGMSAKDAALYSRRITVDFNRKGNYTPVLNTLFMFSNSTLGATMRQIEAIHKGWKTPQGKRALALLFLQGLATAAAEAWINSDDDENEKQGNGTWKDMPEHNYTSRIGIRVGDKFYGLPSHDDPLSRISWLGSSIGRMFFGKMRKADFAKEIGSFGADMAGRFAGKGSTDIASGWNVLAPSALQWVVQAWENKDFAGRPIQRPKFDDAQPWSQNGRASTPQSYKTVAEVLNAIGGGNEARSGKLFGIDKLSTDFSPEMIRHVFNSVFKNVGRDAGDLISMAEVGMRIADFDIRNAPIARNLITKSNGNDNRFFEARKAFDADKKEFDKRTSWEPGEKKKYLAEHPWLRKGNDGKTTVNRLINMTNRDNPRSGVATMGITQLRKLTEGKIRRKDGSYFEPKTPVSDEIKEKAKEWLQKRQARVIEIIGK